MRALENFVNYLEFEKRYSEHTILAYRTDLLQFLEYLEDQYQCNKLNEIEESWIRSWLAYLMDNGNSPKSVNRKMSAIKSFFKYLIRNGQLSKNPSVQIQGPKQKKRLPVFVEERKMNQLFVPEIDKEDYESVRNHLIMELFYTTGMRRAELIGLKTHGIDFNQNLIKVLGKRNKERLLPISEDVKNKIRQFVTLRDKEIEERIDQEYLFITKKGKKLYPKLVYRIVNSYLSTVSTQEKKSPHVLRHTFATHMLNNGADLNAVKELLGHASLAATQIYTHNTIEKLKEVYQQAHPKA
jgi:integrase/recombinase XerC